MNGRLQKKIPLVLFLLLVGCGKSEQEFLSMAAAARAANNPVAAEAALQQGLMEYPSSQDLTFSLAMLYSDTKQWDQLDRYLDLRSFDYDFIFLDEIASVRFNARDWDAAYHAFLRAGDRPRARFPDACLVDVAESYRNAAAAASNMKLRSGIEKSLSKIRMILPKCSNEQSRKEVMRMIDDVSEW